MIRSLVLAVAVALALAGCGTGSRNAASFPLTLATRSVVDLSQLDGQAQWVPAARNRLQQGRWTFDGSGAASFTTVDVRDDVYPLRGSYRVSGDELSFDVQGSSSSSNGGAQAGMKGSVDLAASPPRMTLTWISGSQLAGCVNGVCQGANTSAGYQAELDVAAR